MEGVGLGRRGPRPRVCGGSAPATPPEGPAAVRAQIRAPEKLLAASEQGVDRRDFEGNGEATGKCSENEVPGARMGEDLGGMERELRGDLRVRGTGGRSR